MKIKLLLLMFPFLLSALTSNAQYGNEWIDYSKTYFKVKVTKDAITRIDYSVVNAALTAKGISISTINASDYQLWYRGVQVPIYIGNTLNPQLGAMSPSDFIEFYGNKNDGWYDTKCYRNAGHQPNAYNSLFSDTSTYYLTWDAGTLNSRFASVTNILSALPTPEPFFIDKQVVSNIGTYFDGETRAVAGVIITTPDFEPTEGWIGLGFMSTTKDYFINTPFRYLTPLMPNAELNTVVAGVNKNDNVYPDHKSSVSFNSVLLNTNTFDGFSLKRNLLTVPVSSLLSTNIVRFGALFAGDYQSVPNFDITYPREFKFLNVSAYSFKLLPASGNRYLELQNFNNRGTPPLMLDLTNKIRIIGNTTAVQRFNLPPAAGERKLVVSSQDPFDIAYITNLTPRTFTDFTIPSNQGDFLIISHNKLYNDGLGHNYVQDYVTYRESNAGGNYQVVNADIEELYDQFAHGIYGHPLSIKNYLDFLIDNHAIDGTIPEPHYLLLIGKSICYDEVKFNPTKRAKNLVPTFGSPGGDIMFTIERLDSVRPRLAMGRLSVNNAQQVSDYLEKLKAYESLKNTPSTPYNRDWMRRFINISGAEGSLQADIIEYFHEYYTQLSAPKMGGYRETFIKNTSTDLYDGISAKLDSLFNGGAALLTFWGHSSTGLWDYHIGPASHYNNIYGRFPVILSNSCYAGAIHEESNNSMSEEYVLTPDKGAIAYVASVSYGVVSYLHPFDVKYYKSMCDVNYGKGVGDHMQYAGNSTFNYYDWGTRLTTQEFSLQGDPAVGMPFFTKPDYYIENSYIKVAPDLITVERDSFQVRVISKNIGMAVAGASYLVKVIREYPSGAIDTLYLTPTQATINADTLNFKVGVDDSISMGENKIRVYLDVPNGYDEYVETNNYAEAIFYIYDNDISVTGPTNGGISSGDCSYIKLCASTLIPILPNFNYQFEIDKVPTFDSPALLQTTITQVGGVIEWAPPIAYVDGNVYYWRVKMQDLPGQIANSWHTQSFIYYNSSGTGWSQSTNSQFAANQFQTLELEPTGTGVEFASNSNSVGFKCGLTSVIGAGQVASSINGDVVKANSYTNDCYYFSIGSIMVMAFNPTNGQPVYPIGTGFSCSSVGSFGELFYSTYVPMHDFSQPASGVGLSNFLSFMQTGIPSGYYYLVYSVNDHQLDSTAALYPLQAAIYDFFDTQGMPQIRNVKYNCPFTIFGKKDDLSFDADVNVGTQTTDVFSGLYTLPGKSKSGTMTGSVVGPAKKWLNVNANLNNADPILTDDVVKIEIHVLKTPDQIGTADDSIFYTMVSAFNFFTLDALDASVYPYLYLKYYCKDSINFTPTDIVSWNVYYDEFCELSLSQKDHLSLYDSTLMVGDSVHFKYMVRNISCVNADTAKIEIKVYDKNNVAHIIPYAKKTILAGDSHLVDVKFSTFQYIGDNILTIDVNSDRAIAEKYRFNNFASLKFKVIGDNTDPLVDAMFDGIHIMDGDIISPSPVINIIFKDENKYMPINDTSLFSIQIRKPDLTFMPVFFADPNLSYTLPSTSNLNKDNNEARIEYKPKFNVDGRYELIISGQDRLGNTTSQYAYRIGFEVINKPMISNFLNYPNPFTSSTQFVFTLTGSTIPQVLKIQIMTITGKMVREINVRDMDGIHIGKNISKFTWDGTDQYGDALGNGLYLYRVVAFLNGKEMNHYASGADDFFKKKTLFGGEKDTEYGKMYLMR